MRNEKIRTLLWLSAVLLLNSCGYHFSGTLANIPPGMNKLAVPVFLNNSYEPYIDVEVTQAVIEEFMTDGRLKIVGIEEADLALRGGIVKYEVKPISFTESSGQTFVQQYRVHLVVQAYLEDIRSKKVIWKAVGLESTFISDYAAILGNVSATRVEKDAAIKKASHDIAATVRSSLLEGF